MLRAPQHVGGADRTGLQRILAAFGSSGCIVTGAVTISGTSSSGSPLNATARLSDSTARRLPLHLRASIAKR